ncbi:STE20/SPS1-related proline-alanine-rich protein kinase-like [Herrania umbratica]|uniref:STE20/SPS1-related proline-alanine-rich protein kinase-like n=1 Tax=Herrania umbratica TaxID=108875 RepID=A0A6J0ZXW8_9ROSI|nr:STE20/SPS1-related proline-alanine-rich protein kinase-like [Herrania umbratica]
MRRMGGSQMSYSANPSDYKLLEEVGYGASATVYRAIYLPFNDVVAVKCLDLDRCSSNLDDIRREAQTMSLIDHPNVIRAFCSFVVDSNLWVVMPFMSEGSCLHLMKIAYPDGFEEPAIGSILKETLKALDYLHRQGHIHRDVKAGNILLDNNGTVKLADFGVSACMFDAGDRQRSRNTFVGTPCWMAPEVLQPGSGYNSKADIWSFGITALELAHGHAPFSKYPPMKVLLMTIQNAPPGLDYDRDKKFSKSFKEMVAMCLVKDQTKRPTAEKLLKHSFFKHAKPPELSVKKLFADLPPLWNRVKALQLKDAAQLALKKMPSAEQEAISQSEYQRGVSAWNFDIEDLKVQASLVRDDDDIHECKDDDASMKSSLGHKDAAYCESSLGKLNLNREVSQAETGGPRNVDLSQSDCLNGKGKNPECDIVEAGRQETVSLRKNGSSIDVMASTSEKDVVLTRAKTVKPRQTQSGPLTPGAVLNHSSSERVRNSERFENEILLANEKVCQVRKAPSFSGPLMLPNRASANSLSAPIKSSGGFRDSLDDKSKANLVQIKGRFSVTSENLDLVKDIPLGTVSRRSSQTSPLRKSASVGDWIFESKQVPTNHSPKDLTNGNMPTSIFMTHLQNLFQQTSLQQDLIVNLLNIFQPAEVVDATQNGKLPPLPRCSESNGNVEMAASERERLLLCKILELQSRMMNLTDELTAEKLKYEQLQQQLRSMSGVEENGIRMEGDA